MHKDPFALRSQRCLSAPKHGNWVPGDPHCGSKYLEHHELVGTSKPMITKTSLYNITWINSSGYFAVVGYNI
jgi:hypothetical protein